MGGEAKRRGSFEERKVQAIIRKSEEEEKRRLEWLAKEAAMTEEEKNERLKVQQTLGLISSVAPTWLGGLTKFNGNRWHKSQ